MSTDTFQEHAPAMGLALPAKLLAFSFPALPAEPQVAALGDDEIHVWLALPRPYTPQLRECMGLLSSDELERLERFRFAEHQQDFLFAHSMLRILLGAYLGVAPEQVRFSYSEHGKPRLASPVSRADLQFNLSHTSGAVLLAVCRVRAIGADIERVREDFELEEIASRFFSEEERRSLMSTPEKNRREAFFRCWTRKEAFLKAKGDGLSIPLDRFDVSIAAGEPQVKLVTRPDPKEGERWQIVPVPVPTGYAAAVAVGSSTLKQE